MATRGTRERPRYKQLPAGNAKRVFGADDWLGCLNLLTPARTVAATGLVKTGRVFSLNASIINWNNPGFFSASGLRSAPKHTVLPGKREFASDDVLDGFNPQSSSQWDHFLHFGDGPSQCYYNGHTGTSIGIDRWAERGIAGRAVLLDVGRWAEQVGRHLDWRVRDLIHTADLEGCADAQKVTIEEGTILLIRTGWETAYASLSQADRAALPSNNPVSLGLEPTEAMAARLWDWGVAAVAADNPTLEAYPLSIDGFTLHGSLLGRLGIPIGELWLLDRLADECAAERRYEFLLTSAPLNVPGGVSSPPNALAIL